MDDQQVLERIDQLVQEEEALLHRHEGEGLDDDEHARLDELRVQLDKAYDYLRQRPAPTTCEATSTRPTTTSASAAPSATGARTPTTRACATAAPSRPTSSNPA